MVERKKMSIRIISFFLVCLFVSHSCHPNALLSVAVIEMVLQKAGR